MVLRRNKLILPGLDVLEARQLFSIAYTATLIQPASALPTADNPQGAVAVSGGYVAGNLIYGSTLRSYALQGPGSSPVILQPLQGDSKTIAHSVNTTGLVAGVSYSGGDDGDTDSSDDPHAVLWNGVTGRASSLGGGVATSINSAGLVVGQYHGQAVLFVHSTPRSIGDLGGDTSAAEGINDRNVIVGESDTADGQQSIPYIYDGRRSYAIVPSGLTGSDISGTGNAINSAGEAVGTIGAGAFVYQNGSASLLPLPIENTAITASAANDVNDSGEIVGSVTTAAGSTAVIWPGDGSVIDLNALQSDPTVKLFSAVAIDSDGEVLAYGQQGSTVGTFLLTPQRSHVSTTGTLVITGTEGDDQISITLKSNKYRVSVNDLVVNYAATHVKRISISAGGGDDTITLASNINRSASVDGGDGDDTISGGGGADYLLGNDGNDLLIGNSGRDTLDGGDGTDTAISEKGDTLINIEPQMQAAHR